MYREIKRFSNNVHIHIHIQFSSVAQSCPTLCNPMNHSTPGLPVHHQLREFTQTHAHWVGDAIQPSSVIPFSSCLQSFPTSGSFPMSQLFAWGGQSIGVSASASVLPMNTQDWSPLGWTGWISLQSKGLSRVFSNTTVQKHQFIYTLLYTYFLILSTEKPGNSHTSLAMSMSSAQFMAPKFHFPLNEIRAPCR